MKYFFDTEFIEKPNTIELISIGIVNECDREYYAISNEFNENNADDWVKENVIKKLETNIKRKSLLEIKDDILKFVGEDKKPEFWAYYADYDWVVFCWLFGKMIDLPKHFPMYCKDLKQCLDFYNIKYEDLPRQGNEHNALDDARWNKKVYEIIKKRRG